MNANRVLVEYMTSGIARSLPPDSFSAKPLAGITLHGQSAIPLAPTRNGTKTRYFSGPFFTSSVTRVLVLPTNPPYSSSTASSLKC